MYFNKVSIEDGDIIIKEKDLYGCRSWDFIIENTSGFLNISLNLEDEEIDKLSEILQRISEKIHGG